jgi:hypothetical protein
VTVGTLNRLLVHVDRRPVEGGGPPAVSLHEGGTCEACGTARTVLYDHDADEYVCIPCLTRGRRRRT